MSVVKVMVLYWFDLDNIYSLLCSFLSLSSLFPRLFLFFCQTFFMKSTKLSCLELQLNCNFSEVKENNAKSVLLLQMISNPSIRFILWTISLLQTSTDTSLRFTPAKPTEVNLLSVLDLFIHSYFFAAFQSRRSSQYTRPGIIFF